MTDQELRKQIDAFFDGDLSDSEEQVLRKYLATHEVSREFHGEKRVILALLPDGTNRLPEGLEGRMSSFIDRLPMHKQRHCRRGLSPAWRWISGIAAALILASAAGIYISRQSAMPKFSEQELYACTEAQHALILVSQKLNKGSQQWQEAQQEIAKTKQIINKHFKYK